MPKNNARKNVRSRKQREMRVRNWALRASLKAPAKAAKPAKAASAK